MPRTAPWQIARHNEPSPDTKSGNRKKEAGIAIVYLRFGCRWHRGYSRISTGVVRVTCGSASKAFNSNIVSIA